MPDAGTQAVEVGILGGLGRWRGGAFKDQASQTRTVVVLADQLTDIRFIVPMKPGQPVTAKIVNDRTDQTHGAQATRPAGPTTTAIATTPPLRPRYPESRRTASNNLAVSTPTARRLRDQFAPSHHHDPIANSFASPCGRDGQQSGSAHFTVILPTDPHVPNPVTANAPQKRSRS